MTKSDCGSGSAIRFIEFIGLPGSGKSTIAAHLEAALQGRGVKTVSRSEILADQSSFVRRQCKRLVIVCRNAGKCWRLYYRSLNLIADSGQKSTKDVIKVTWNLWSVIALIADGRGFKDGITIVDQGLLQAIWSVQLTSSKTLSLDFWTKLLLSAGIMDLLIVNVQSDIPIARNRVSTRTSKGTRLDPDEKSDPADPWQRASMNMADLIHLAHQIFPRDQVGSRVITVENNSLPPEAAASMIASAFLARAKSARCTGA